ncbi:class I SAM-dependent methyltransferase [Herbaspirillum chlorophenolicum]|uniref:Class I SAM-dependent methyltransferase n=1 Tax=Herbaspirillum chlorophenolicum TaxID=211589 RepID=A0ABW8EU96_9BURK
MSERNDASAGTLGHYRRNASGFREGTWAHDVSQNIAALLEALAGRDGASSAARFSILDFGCGPGRDLLALSRLGHEAVGLDGAEEFVRMAREASGCEVWHQDFLQLDLPASRFDGIFANASLFHVPSADLPRVLGQLRDTLKADGILFSSNPRGEDVEGWSGERYGVWHSLEGWRRYLQDAGFAELRHYYRPDGLPREQQPWLASVWGKVA